MPHRPVRHRAWQRLALAAALCAAAEAGAADAGAEARIATRLSTLSIEELADIEVSSVSKRPERLADAAAAVYVITRDDIARSGVLTIAEALRLAPNLQVARTNANT